MRIRELLAEVDWEWIQPYVQALVSAGFRRHGGGRDPVYSNGRFTVILTEDRIEYDVRSILPDAPSHGFMSSPYPQSPEDVVTVVKQLHEAVTRRLQTAHQAISGIAEKMSEIGPPGVSMRNASGSPVIYAEAIKGTARVWIGFYVGAEALRTRTQGGRFLFTRVPGKDRLKIAVYSGRKNILNRFESVKSKEQAWELVESCWRDIVRAVKAPRAFSAVMGAMDPDELRKREKRFHSSKKR